MWSTSATDLRNLISDGPTDKRAYRKKVVGYVDGTNTTFKTFEWRRTSDFTASGVGTGVFVNNVQGTVTSDTPSTGEFALSVAPPYGTGVAVYATYYYQWFLDSEIAVFLKSSAQWLGFSNDPTVIPEGLQPAALHFAAQEAYSKIAMFWSIRISESYMLEDAPAPDTKGPVEQFIEMSKYFREKAIELRDNFYTRQGQSLAPMSTSIAGIVGAVTPRR